MSALVILPSTTAVIVATDTAFATSSLREEKQLQLAPGMCKAVVLPHLSAMLAFRGHATFGHSTYMSLALSFGGSSFDQLVSALPGVADLNQQLLLQNYERLGWERPAGLGELVLSGWSEGMHQMQSWLCVNSELGAPFECLRLMRPYIAPCDGFDSTLRGGNPEDVADLMRRQIVGCRPMCPALGGSMVYSLMQRNRVHTEVHNLERLIGAAPVPVASVH